MLSASNSYSRAMLGLYCRALLFVVYSLTSFIPASIKWATQVARLLEAQHYDQQEVDDGRGK